MENEQLIDSHLSSSELNLNSSAKEFLRQAAKWAKFLSIVGIIGAGFIVVLGFAFGAIMNIIMSMSPSAAMTGSAMMIPRGLSFGVGVMYAIFGMILMYPAIRLLQFSSRTKMALEMSDTLAMEEGMRRLRSFFRFYGILTIVMLSFYALAIVVVIVGLAVH